VAQATEHPAPELHRVRAVAVVHEPAAQVVAPEQHHIVGRLRLRRDRDRVAIRDAEDAMQPV
jgi:hypothetical protein